MRNFLLVMLAGALGTGARYGVNLLAVRWPHRWLPWGTLLVNVVGAFLIGAMSELRMGQRLLTDEQAVVLTVGFLGGFTTFSALSREGLAMLEHRAFLAAAIYLGGSLVFGLAAAYLGARLGRLFVGV